MASDEQRQVAIAFETRGFVFASYLNVGIAIFARKLPVELVPELRTITSDLIRDHGCTSTLYIPIHNMPMPDAATRTAVQALSNELASNLIAVAVVITGDGFWTSAMRGLATSMHWFNKQKFKMRAVATVAEGVTWLATLHSAESLAVEPSELQAVIAPLLERSSLRADLVA
jgi:hypothetical protein